jgi:pilus assembly protein CpaF
VVILEDTPEVMIDSDRWVGLRTRQANVEGRGAIDLQSLVVESLRMKPDRIVIGEVRSNELVPLLQALNTGHGGSASTLHANSLADVPNRLLAIAKTAGLDAWALSELASSAISCVVQLGVVDGRRKIEAIGEFSKTKRGWLEIQPITLASHLQLVPTAESQALMFA